MSATLAALPAARAADAARYAIAGVAPGVALEPASAEEAAAVVRECSQRGLALVPWGGGVALAHELAAPPRYDVALDLKHLHRITVFEPDDFTVTAQCGITVAALREALAARGQELPLEAAGAATATLGGVLAANASGARRLRFGSPRDRLLGARFVTGDGVLARTGGRVVKNVAGHAVHRLLVGSRGGLGVLLEASLKLLPEPPARALLVYGADAAALADASRWHEFARREPAALSVLAASRTVDPALATDAPFTVAIGWEGDPRWVEACVAWTRERLGAPAELRRDAQVPRLWQALADASEAPGARLTLASAHHSPAAIAELGHGDAFVFHAPSGRLEIWPEPGEAPARARAFAARGFAPTEARGLEDLPPAPPASVLALRARLADALDPEGALALGLRWRTGR